MNGRKRHVVTDTIGLLVVVLVTAGSVQYRDGGRPVLKRARAKMPSHARVWADGGYAGGMVESARSLLGISLEIVKKPEGQHAFEVLPRRWVVERTLSWLVRCRRMGRGCERLPAHAEAMVKCALIGLMARRLTPAPGRRPWQAA
ncbi:transposase [Arthrobacter sp. I2-34]|uniref:Transposase n=1 Tax=Arthrobacter hankyongi TaxID=2904801 RepID=A0ABS9LBQ5_9MICC|nr:transposase [Arthrobacter hankyongi]